MAIYITGDVHGWNGSRWKLGPESFETGQSLTRDDYVILAGDVALLFYCDANKPFERSDNPYPEWECTDQVWEQLQESEWAWREWLELRPWTTLFVDGNHENHEALDALPVEKWRSGLVHRVSDHVLHLMRGCVYDLPTSRDGTLSLLALGGAESTDRHFRREGADWWAREVPSEEEMERAEAELEKRGWKVDHVVTHAQPPEVAAEALGLYSQTTVAAGGFANRIGALQDRLDYGWWWSGHLHVDHPIPRKRHTVLFDAIYNMETGELA